MEALAGVLPTVPSYVVVHWAFVLLALLVRVAGLAGAGEGQRPG